MLMSGINAIKKITRSIIIEDKQNDTNKFADTMLIPTDTGRNLNYDKKYALYISYRIVYRPPFFSNSSTPHQINDTCCLIISYHFYYSFVIKRSRTGMRSKKLL